jgi:hypothetical protein
MWRDDGRLPTRDRYDGVAREVAVWWTLRREATKGEAVCRMFTHVFGHELRLEVRAQLVESQVCRTDERSSLPGALARRARGQGLEVLATGGNPMAMPLDDHNQPPGGVNRRRRTERDISELLGLAKGMLSDGIVNQDEAAFLKAWGENHVDALTQWPVSIIFARLQQVLADGHVDEAGTRRAARPLIAAGWRHHHDSPRAGWRDASPARRPAAAGLLRPRRSLRLHWKDGVRTARQVRTRDL